MMIFTGLLLALITNAMALDASAARSLQEVPDGAYWSIYNATEAPAETSCNTTAGKSVAESCCVGGGQLLAHADIQGNDTCFLLGPGGPVPFSGCVGDGLAGYGEDCTGEGAPFVAANANECGCDFVLEGSGCFRANDLPGQQWFVFLDGASCKEDTTSGTFQHQGTLTLLFLVGLIFTFVPF